MIARTGVAALIAAALGILSGADSVMSGMGALQWEAPRWVAAFHLLIGTGKIAAAIGFVTLRRPISTRFFFGLFSLATVVDLNSYVELPLSLLLTTPAALIVGIASVARIPERLRGSRSA